MADVFLEIFFYSLEFVFRGLSGLLVRNLRLVFRTIKNGDRFYPKKTLNNHYSQNINSKKNQVEAFNILYEQQ